MKRMKREEINVRGEILSLEAGQSIEFPSVVKGTYVRNVCSSLKFDEGIVCTVNRIGSGCKVTRIK